MVNVYNVTINADTKKPLYSPLGNGSLAIATVTLHRLDGIVHPPAPLKRLFLKLAPGTGFEPMTPWLTAKCCYR